MALGKKTLKFRPTVLLYFVYISFGFGIGQNLRVGAQNVAYELINFFFKAGLMRESMRAYVRDGCLVAHNLATQSVIHGPAALASPVRLLEMQNFMAHLSPEEPDQHCNQIPR